MRRQILKVIAIAAVIVLVLFVGYRVVNKIKQGSKKGVAVVYTVGSASLKKQTVTQVMSYQGILEGDPQVRIYPSVTGKFEENLVQEGMTVYADQTLALINRDIVGSDYKSAPVKSPIAGVVTKLYYTDRGTSVSINNPVAEVANINKIKVVINTGEDDLMKIRKGYPASIYSLSDKKIALTASVYSVTPFVDRDTLSGSFTVKTWNQGGFLKIGMSVGVDIIIGKIQAYMVPQESVIMGLDKVYIFIQTNGKAKQVEVTQGYVKDNLVEIKGNFRDGDQVITEGAFKLFDGAAIQVIQ